MRKVRRRGGRGVKKNQTVEATVIWTGERAVFRCPACNRYLGWKFDGWSFSGVKEITCPGCGCDMRIEADVQRVA